MFARDGGMLAGQYVVYDHIIPLFPLSPWQTLLWVVSLLLGSMRYIQSTCILYIMPSASTCVASRCKYRWFSSAGLLLCSVVRELWCAWLPSLSSSYPPWLVRGTGRTCLDSHQCNAHTLFMWRPCDVSMLSWYLPSWLTMGRCPQPCERLTPLWRGCPFPSFIMPTWHWAGPRAMLGAYKILIWHQPIPLVSCTVHTAYPILDHGFMLKVITGRFYIIYIFYLPFSPLSTHPDSVILLHSNICPSFSVFTFTVWPCSFGYSFPPYLFWSWALFTLHSYSRYCKI